MGHTQQRPRKSARTYQASDRKTEIPGQTDVWEDMMPSTDHAHRLTSAYRPADRSEPVLDRLSRRQVLRAILVGGIAVYLAPLGSRAYSALFEDELLTVPDRNGRNGSLSPTSRITDRAKLSSVG